MRLQFYVRMRVLNSVNNYMNIFPVICVSSAGSGRCVVLCAYNCWQRTWSCSRN